MARKIRGGVLDRLAWSKDKVAIDSIMLTVQLLTILNIAHEPDIRGTVFEMEAIIGLFHLDVWNVRDMTLCCRQR